MTGKSIKAKAYEKIRDYLKLNFKYPDFSISLW